MKRLRLLMLAAASAPSLAAPALAQMAPSDITVALVLGERGSGFHQAIACGARAKAAELGINVEIQAAARYSSSEQIPLLATMLATSPDAIVLDPTSSTALIAPLREAVDAGTLVVAVDTTLDDPSFLTAEIGTDNVEVGREAARALVELLDGREGKVAMVNAIPGITTVDQRIEGFEAEIANHPGIDYIGNQFATEDVGLAQAAFSALISANPDLIGVAALSNTPAIGVAGGIRAAGVSEDVVAVGVDADATEIQAMRDGLLDALVIQQPIVMGSEGVQQAFNALTGAPVETPIGTGNITATLDTLDTPEVQQYLYEGDCI